MGGIGGGRGRETWFWWVPVAMAVLLKDFSGKAYICNAYFVIPFWRLIPPGLLFLIYRVLYDNLYKHVFEIYKRTYSCICLRVFRTLFLLSCIIVTYYILILFDKWAVTQLFLFSRSSGHNRWGHPRMDKVSVRTSSQHSRGESPFIFCVC